MLNNIQLKYLATSLRLLFLILFLTSYNKSLSNMTCDIKGVYEVKVEYSQNKWKQTYKTNFIIADNGRADQSVDLYHFVYDTVKSLSFDKKSIKNEYSKNQKNEIIITGKCTHILTTDGIVKPNSIHGGTSKQSGTGRNYIPYQSACPVDVYFYGKDIRVGSNIIGGSNIPIMPLNASDKFKEGNFSISRMVTNISWSNSFIDSYNKLNHLILSNTYYSTIIPKSIPINYLHPQYLTSSYSPQNRNTSNKEPLISDLYNITDSLLYLLISGRIGTRYSQISRVSPFRYDFINLDFFSSISECQSINSIESSNELPNKIAAMIDLFSTNDSAIIPLIDRYYNELKSKKQALEDRVGNVQRAKAKFNDDLLTMQSEYDSISNVKDNITGLYETIRHLMSVSTFSIDTNKSISANEIVKTIYTLDNDFRQQSFESFDNLSKATFNSIKAKYHLNKDAQHKSLDFPLNKNHYLSSDSLIHTTNEAYKEFSNKTQLFNENEIRQINEIFLKVIKIPNDERNTEYLFSTSIISDSSLKNDLLLTIDQDIKSDLYAVISDLQQDYHNDELDGHTYSTINSYHKVRSKYTPDQQHVLFNIFRYTLCPITNDSILITEKFAKTVSQRFKYPYDSVRIGLAQVFKDIKQNRINNVIISPTLLGKVYMYENEIGLIDSIISGKLTLISNELSSISDRLYAFKISNDSLKELPIDKFITTIDEFKKRFNDLDTTIDIKDINIIENSLPNFDSIKQTYSVQDWRGISRTFDIRYEAEYYSKFISKLLDPKSRIRNNSLKISRYLISRYEFIQKATEEIKNNIEYYSTKYPYNPFTSQYDSTILDKLTSTLRLIDTMYMAIMPQKRNNVIDIENIETNIPLISSSDIYQVFNDWNTSRGYSALWSTKGYQLKESVIYSFLKYQWGSISYDIQTGEWILKTTMADGEKNQNGNCTMCCARMGFKIISDQIKITSFYVFSECN